MAKNRNLSGMGESVDDFTSRLDPTPEVRDLRTKVKTLSSHIDSLKKDEGFLENLFADLKGSLEVIDPPKLVYKPNNNSLDVASVCAAVSHFTDWHYGEVSKKEELSLVYDFDPVIAERRMDLYTDKFLRFIDLHRSSYSIKNWHVIVTGDLISGDIHPELIASNAFPIPQQAIGAGMLLASVIAKCSPYFENVIVDFIVPDNHGRLTKKLQFKQGGLNSMNYVVGWVAKERVCMIKNVKFNLHMIDQVSIQVPGCRYLCAHGAVVKGTWGIPYYGVDRLVGLAAKSRMNNPDANKHFDKVLIGHFHAPLKTPYWLIGGSLGGTNEMDHSNNRFAKPIQTAWIAHPKYTEHDYNEFELLEPNET